MRLMRLASGGCVADKACMKPETPWAKKAWLTSGAPGFSTMEPYPSPPIRFSALQHQGSNAVWLTTWSPTLEVVPLVAAPFEVER